MQNKLYTIIANLYNEIKNFKGKSNTLEEAVDSVIYKNKEIIDARSGMATLKDRFDDIHGLINSKNLDILEVDNKIQQVKNDIASKIPNSVTQVISDESKDVVVSLENKINHKEDIIVIQPGGNVILANENEFYLSKAYMNTNSSTSMIRNVDFLDSTKVSYDASKETLNNSELTANGETGLYELPLKIADIIRSEEIDSCYVQNVCNVVSDYNSIWKESPSDSTYENHLVNSFKSGKAWHIKRGYVSFVVTFTEPISISRVCADLDTNGSSLSCSIESSVDGTTWSTFSDGNNKVIDTTTPTNVLSKYIRFGITSFDSLPGRTITIKNVKMYTCHYNTVSSVIRNTEPIILDSTNPKVCIKNNSVTENHKLIDHRYAISNSSDEDHKEWFTYVPQTLTRSPKDFIDTKGFRVVNNVVKNNYKMDVNAKTLIDTKVYKTSPVANVSGSIGIVSITRETEVKLENSWKPTSLIAMYVLIIIDGVKHQVPLDINNINNIVKADIAGIVYDITIRVLDTRVLKVSVQPEKNNVASIVADSIQVVFTAPKNLGNWNWCNSSLSCTAYDNTLDYHHYNIYNVDVNYATGNQWYGWKGAPYFNYNTWVDKSGYCASDCDVTCAILSRSMYSGTMITSRTEGTMFYQTVERKDCELPCAVYLGTGGVTVLKAFIDNDVENIQTINIEPKFLEDQEYVTKHFISTAELTAVVPQQHIVDSDDIQYAISFDGYNYYYQENNKWLSYTHKGMSSETLRSLNNASFNYIRNGREWIWVKVLIKGMIASLTNITFNFDQDVITHIKEDEIISKGMSKATLESMDPNKLIKVAPILFIGAIAKSDLPMYQYKLSGYEIYNYKDIRWEEIDNVKIKEYLLNDSSLMYKNNHSAQITVKVVRNIIENKTAIVDVRESTKDLIKVLEDKSDSLSGNVDLLTQNIKIMHDTFLSTGSIPATLPNVILKNTKDYDVPLLKPGEFHVIEGVDSLRGFQVWEEKMNFVGYSDKLVYDTASGTDFMKSLVEVSNDGAKLSIDYDRDNPYLMPEEILENTGNMIKTKMSDIYYDFKANSGDASLLLNQYGNVSGSWLQWWWAANTGDTVYWHLPGENRRWVDIKIDFRENVYINYLNDLWFAGYGNGEGYGNADNRGSIENQLTSFAWSYDDKEYTTISTMQGLRENATVIFNRELRYIRIRLERPYSDAKGAGTVSFKGVDVYFSPKHYVHDVEGYIYNATPIDTTNWSSISKINVDRYIDHNPCEMKFLLSDDTVSSKWKYWSGAQWIETSSMSLSDSMSVETLLSLGPDQLNKLKRGSLFVCAVMKTTDIWKTPVIREVEILHDKTDNYKYHEAMNSNEMDIKWYPNDNRLIVRNNTGSDKKIKIIMI